MAAMMATTGMKDGAISMASLERVSETLLFPLISRCVESEKENGILKDPRSREILDALDVDISQVRVFLISQLGVCLRTNIIDDAAARFMKAHPDAVVVNLGCGLDTRFERIDNGSVTWIDIDLPGVIPVRKKFFTETRRNRFIAQSVLDEGWVEHVPRRRNVLFIAEGLSYYLTEGENRKLLGTIRNNFRESEMLIEAMHPLYVSMFGKKKYDDELTDTIADQLKWGIKSGREFEGWHDGIRCVNEWYTVNSGRQYFPKKIRVLFTLVPLLARMIKVIQLRFD